MLMIRLQRVGKKKQAYFRVVLTEHTKKPQGEYQELLGTYDPHAKRLAAQTERITFWLSQGALLSPTANNLLANHKILDREKVQSWKPKKKAATA
ncbi:MAG: 30S ribosomal protein S16 [Candidatus Paceibacterota bacterium]|nr:MAG: 30S ribosomal protein S16 [Candidatus Paceibacterota bacterium]